MKNKIILTLILLLSLFLRFYKLGSLPNAYTPDEVAQGYTAYSILKTGKDEWGSRNWLTLKSFGDYKPPLQTLFMIPSIKIFGLTPFAIRFPNALLSIFTVLLAYLIAKKLFNVESISLLSAFLVSVSPHLLPMSRIALEANILVFLTSLGTYLFFTNLPLSAIAFGLTLFTYHSAKVFVPVLIIALFIYTKKFNKTFLVIFSLFLAILILNNKGVRMGDIAITHPTDNWQGLSSDQYQMRQNGSPKLITRLLNNKLTYVGKVFAQNYFSYLSPQFLATTGAGETTYGMLPGFGIVSYIGTLGILYTIYIVIKKKPSRQLKLLFFLLLFAPCIPALAKGTYSANRISILAPFIQIICAYGLIALLNNKYLKILITLLLFFESAYFFQTYFYRANQILADGMLFGHKEAIGYVKQLPEKTIIYSRKLSEPQAYVAFFNQIDPSITQKDFAQIKQDFTFLDQVGEYKLANYIFKNIDFVRDSQIPNVVLVGKTDEIPNDKVTLFVQDKIAIFYETK